MSPGPWNWLEIAKLVAGLLTPIAIAIFGIYVHRVTKRFENLQWRSQKLIEKRLSVYDDIAPILNDLLCYFNYLGCWKELNPPDVVALKRKLDKKIHLAAPLFSEEFFNESMKFIDLCFETYSGWGRDALLKTKWQRRKEARPKEWDDEWVKYFSEVESNPKDIGITYRKIMEYLASDIGVHPSFVVPDSGRVPGNIR